MGGTATDGGRPVDALDSGDQPVDPLASAPAPRGPAGRAVSEASWALRLLRHHGQRRTSWLLPSAGDPSMAQVALSTLSARSGARQLGTLPASPGAVSAPAARCDPQRRPPGRETSAVKSRMREFRTSGSEGARASNRPGDPANFTHGSDQRHRGREGDRRAPHRSATCVVAGELRSSSATRASSASIVRCCFWSSFSSIGASRW